MEQINKIELLGTIGSSRTNTFGDNRQVLHGTIATNYIYKDKAGCPVIETTWTSFVYWPKFGEDVAPFTKGSKAHIFGRLKNSKYMAADGTERTTTEVVASSIEKVEE